MKLRHLAIAFGVFATPAHAQSDCAGLVDQKIPLTIITEAQEVHAPATFADASRESEGMPIAVERSFCRVKGTLKPSPASRIGFETWLPTEWNGDYFQTGNGGLAGIIRYPELAHALNRGFAASSTDDGTSLTDPSWAVDPDRMLDFRDRAVHLTAVAGQALTKAHYGKAARHRFFVGGSKGGQEAMNEVQRHPEDFDGVVALYPAARGAHQAASTLWWAQQMTRGPGSMLGEAELGLLKAGVIDACGGNDGGLSTDGFLTDPTQCKFDPVVLQCKSGQREGCLSAEQIETARRLYAGPEKFPELRLLPGSEWPQLGNLHGWKVLDGSLVKAFQLELSIGQGVLGKPGWSYRDFDVESDLPKMIAAGGGEPGDTFDPNIRAFQTNGGKLILIHGWNDPMVPSLHSPLYWDMVVADQAKARPEADALATTREFFRLFMVPGYGHGHGDGLEPSDPLSAIVEWVKSGKAPETLEAVVYSDAAQWAAADRAPSAYVPDTAGADGLNRPVELARELCAWPARTKVTASGAKCVAGK